MEAYAGAQAGPILIGRLRQEYGCPGLDKSTWPCPWMFAVQHLPGMSVDDRIPRIGGVQDKRKVPGSFI